MKLKNKLKEIRKKGFTLIELIVVIAVLGILVLMAAPKFLGYTAEAKMKQIQNDIKAHEVQGSVELMNNPNAESTWTALTPDELSEINGSNKVLDKKGELVTAPIIGEDSYVLDLDEVKSKLKGKFIWTEKDEVVYYDKNLGKLPEIGEGDGSGDGGSEELPEFTPENHFDFVDDSSGYEVEGKGKGYYKYIGTGEEIVNIPHEIDGHKFTSYYRMFNDTGADVKKVVSTNTEVTDMTYMFRGSQAGSLDLSNFNTSKVTSMSYMFQNSKVASLDLSNFDTSEVTDMRYMFYQSQATSLDLSNFDTSEVTDMRYMFAYSKVASLDLSKFNTRKVANMASMFSGSEAMSLDLSNFNTSEVTNMAQMFYTSKATSLDLRSFDTINVTNMSWMFSSSEAKSLDLSSFDTRKVTNMGYMFSRSQANSLDLSSFDTINVTDMSQMFLYSKATSIVGLSNFDTRKVTNMSQMFSGSKAMSLDLSSFDTINVTNMSQMFNASKATTGYAKTEDDAIRFNAETTKRPNGLEFIVK